MRNLIYVCIIFTIFISCEEDFPAIYDPNPQPMDTLLVDPMDTITNPMDTITNPMDTITNPMDTITNPMDTITNPMDTITNPMDTITNPMDTITNPMDTITNPIDTITNPMDTITNPMDTITNPMDTITNPMDALMVVGLTYANSDKTIEEADAAIIEALNSVDPIRIIAEINHSDNAASVDLSLNSTKVILFGNPALGTPLMQTNQFAGLDLPQKILLFEDDNDQLIVAYNSVDYLTLRHSLQGVESLNTIRGALANFAGRAATEEFISEDAAIAPNEGMIMETSRNTFEVTYERIINVLNANNINIVAEIDHQANAESVGLELAPTKLVIFGNPILGTPLMQSAPTTGIDLPLKMLVIENNIGEVQVAYNDPAFLAKRHGIEDNENTLNMMANTLNNIVRAAIN